MMKLPEQMRTCRPVWRRRGPSSPVPGTRGPRGAPIVSSWFPRCNSSGFGAFRRNCNRKFRINPPLYYSLLSFAREVLCYE